MRAPPSNPGWARAGAVAALALLLSCPLLLAGGPGTVTPARADLVATAALQAPSTLPAGASFSLTLTIRNAGLRAAGRFTVAAFLSQNAVRDAGDVRLLGSRRVARLSRGARTTTALRLTLPASVAAGRHQVLLCADVGGADYGTGPVLRTSRGAGLYTALPRTACG